MTYIPPHLRPDNEKDKLLFGKTLGKFVSTGEFPKERKKSGITELSVHNQVCKYLKVQYPKVMFISDFGAGIKLSPGMASRQSMQKSNHSFPDINVIEPKNGFNGLFIEVKRDKDAIYNKDGSFKKSDHINDQINCIAELNKKGYLAKFGCGFEECKNIIDGYLK